MGCGVSKVENGGEVVPARLRPLLRRKFEDIKFRKVNALKSKDSNLSKKQLLIDGADDDDSRKSVSSPEDSITPPLAPQPETKKNEVKDEVVVNVVTPRSNKVAPEPQYHKPSKEINDRDLNHKEIIDKKDVNENLIVKDVLMIENDDVEGEDDDGEDGRLSDVEGSYICPGSPSFRVYCLDQSICDTEDEGKDDEEEGTLIQPSQSRQSSDDTESMKSSEEPETKIIKKKGKRGYRIKRVIPKGKLLNVTSCYNPACSGGHEKTRLLTEKAAAE